MAFLGDLGREIAVTILGVSSDSSKFYNKGGNVRRGKRGVMEKHGSFPKANITEHT